ncbi:hypothetical protein bcgnr5390_24380 [Bacillus luti]
MIIFLIHIAIHNEEAVKQVHNIDFIRTHIDENKRENDFHTNKK